MIAPPNVHRLAEQAVYFRLQAGAAHLQQEAVAAQVQHLQKPLHGC